jgi:hypothetical protein
MKFLTIVIGVAGVAVVAGALALGCGPQKAYCPQFSTGQCINQDTGTAPPGEDAGPSESTILGADT